MAATTVKIAYISASTNRHSQAADISTASVAAFGSSNLIAIWNVNSEDGPGVSETLPGHDGTVTCVRFISDAMFASADDKGTLMCWRNRGCQWIPTLKVQAHAKAISSLCALDHCIVTGSSDASVKIWKLQSAEQLDDLIEIQIISLQGKYPLAVSLAHLPDSNVAILAIGGTDRNVQIWVRSESHFVHAAALSGHEDWVKGLAFLAPSPGGQALTLASGSQDATIRLWSIESLQKDLSTSRSVATDILSDDLLDTFEASLGDLGENEEGGRQISLKRHILTVKSDQGSFQQYSITFDALLIGHDAGITSVSWSPVVMDSAPTLLSTSTDSSLIMWSPSASGASLQGKSFSIWISRQRFGDVGGQRLGGFVGGAWAHQGKQALAWGWGGGWRRWRCVTPSQIGSEKIWTEVGAISGHSGPVKGIDWSPNGNYLISVGLDQTTRLHGAISPFTADSVWHELGRPQVHGYDLLDAAFIDPLRFVSIADEKVARVFEAPRGFVQLTEGLGISKFAEKEHLRPLGASVPPLGLSNKALGEGHSGTLYNFRDGTMHRRPFEGELASITLWPEVEKIFGHGYESITLTVSSSKRFLATSCKATTPEHAVVRVYNTENYHLVGQPLEGHSLTVTRIAFSPDDKFVLSVSRDRSWQLFEFQNPGAFVPVAADKSHGRIIWDCAWAAEGYIFATASRDKTVKIWSRGDSSNWKTVATIKTNVAATAVDFSTTIASVRHQLAIGLESGEVLIYSNLHSSAEIWSLDVTIPPRTAHVDQIHRLRWHDGDLPGQSMLASCSEDGTIRVLIVQSAIE
ncbi:WD40 repeat-like protein [Tricholoma matsutake]|nr:WD40 repeat-like protein [Tricholoma matsutake 945]